MRGECRHLPCYLKASRQSRVSDGYGQFPLASASFGQKERLVCPFSPAEARAMSRASGVEMGVAPARLPSGMAFAFAHGGSLHPLFLLTPVVMVRLR